jgi:hypothetical protein
MEGEDTYKQEIKKPELKTLTAEIDIVVSVKTSPTSDLSIGLISGSESKNSSIDLGGVVSLGGHENLQTGEKTTSIKGPGGLLSSSINSKNELTVAAQLDVKLGAIAIEAKTNLGDAVNNATTLLDRLRDTLESTVPSAGIN